MSSGGMMQQGGSANRLPDGLAVTAAAVLLVAALGFGGGSRGAGDLVVHLAGLPALLLGIQRWRQVDAVRLQRLFLYWLLAALALVALQLLPLPADFFSALPQRASVQADLNAAALDPAWLPMTMDTWGTIRALLALATFGAMWLLASTLPSGARLRLLKLAVLVALPLALLGFWQSAAGHQPTLRFHAFRNEFGATATFANRNHFAALLAMLLPLSLLFARTAQQARNVGAAAGWYGASAVLLLATALTFSRGGVLLAMLATGATVLLLLGQRTQPGARIRGSRRALFAALLLAAVAIAHYAWDRFLDRFDADPLADTRWQYIDHGLEAMRAWLPWGSGLGSFRDVYAPFEPVTAMLSSHALHAHNDILELAIETGVPGLALLLALLLLIAAMLRNIRVDSASLPPILAAAGIAALVPLLHSLVDYPLRTLAVATLFALLLAHLAAPARAAFPTHTRHGRRDVLPR